MACACAIRVTVASERSLAPPGGTSSDGQDGYVAARAGKQNATRKGGVNGTTSKDAVGVTPDMMLDESKRGIMVQDEIAEDFNGALLQRVRDAVAGARADADVALVAARLALIHANAE